MSFEGGYYIIPRKHLGGFKKKKEKLIQDSRKPQVVPYETNGALIPRACGKSVMRSNNFFHLFSFPSLQKKKKKNSSRKQKK